MTKDEEKKLQQLETRVRQLILAYASLKEQIQQVEEQLLETQTELEDVQAQNVALKKQYDMLKLSRMLAIDGEDGKMAKRQISALIREVDRCIALLNV